MKFARLIFPFPTKFDTSYLIFSMICPYAYELSDILCVYIRAGLIGIAPGISISLWPLYLLLWAFVFVP